MFKKVEVSIIILLFAFATYCSLITGSFWDEIYEMNIGKDRLKYLFSFGSYKYFDFHIYTEFYPGFYNTLAIFVTKIFPIKYETEVWRLTHVSFSILSIFGIYKISSNLFNKKVGKIVFLLCFLNPIFFGHMIMNSKDTIVVFAHVWSTYIFLRYLQKQDKKKKRNRYVLLAGLTIGLGMGVRFPFLVTLLPLFIFALIDTFFLKKIIIKNFSFKNYLADLCKIFSIAYLVSICFWPQVYSNIFTEPFNLLMELISQHGAGVPWMLFNGNIFPTNQLPNTYIITNLIYKSPEFLILCYLLFIFFIMINKKSFLNSFNFFWAKIFLLLLILLFPLIYFIFLPFRVYDGLRLFLYIIPYFTIIPGLSIYYLINNYHDKISKYFSFIIALLFIYYLYIFILLTPFQYTYLNKFTGNFSNAHEKFENDYFAISIKELVNKISKKNSLMPKDQKIKISFCGVNNKIVMNELNKLRDFNYEVKHLSSNDFDYVIMTNRAFAEKSSMIAKDVKTCFKKIDGEDFIKVMRNGLMLSTLRKNVE